MKRKLLIILEIIVIIFASLYYLVKEVIPEYKKNKGSSDGFVNTKIISNTIEFKINNNVNFAILLTEDNQLEHILFFDEKSLCLYNKNIENKKIAESLEIIIKLLIENNFLDSFSNLEIIRYENDNYVEFLNVLSIILKKYEINCKVIETVKNLEDKVQELDLDYEEFSALINLDYYSIEIIKEYKSKEKHFKNEKLNYDNANTFKNNVYKKLEKYIKDSNIKNLDKDNTELLITMIPSDSNGNYYPTDKSWYLVDSGKVYAYIELIYNNQSFGYCYNGSIDLVKEGVC